MEKIAERTNVLTETENKSFVHAVLNAVTKGYSDNTVLEDIMDLVRRKEVSKGVIQAAPEALRSIGESIEESLGFLADQIDDLEIIDEPTVKRKERTEEDNINVVEEEMNKQEEENPEKTASLDKFADLEIKEDWSQYLYDKKKNVMTGHLLVDFKQDMTPYQGTEKVSLNQKELDTVLGKVYSYFTAEFKNLKAGLSTDIFSSAMAFTSIKDGLAEVNYKIEGAF